ncbi:MAG: alkaline phosphatase family protein [Ignavibacteria bacterium]|nr:alkaline phosphatase family protein [Ignavibacteria bacterium]
MKYLTKLFLLQILILSLSLSLYAQNKPYVILISMDGFRWDYIYRGITPNLNKLKDEGVHALSLRPSFPSKTFPNHYSIITGMYPENHGIIFNSFTNIFTGETYRIGDTITTRQSKWYKGEAFWETANRHNIKTASFFWVGSEQDVSYKQPTYFHPYDQKISFEERVNGVIKWLQLPENERPQFITLYFEEPDSKGHSFGPNSPETNKAIALVDSMLGLLINSLKKIEMEDKVNIIVVSDHGMTEVSDKRIIKIEEILKDYKCKFYGMGTSIMIDAEPDKLNEIYQVLKKNEKNYRVYTKENIPEYFHFSENPFILPIIVIAETGWTLVTDEYFKRGRTYSVRGDHGFDNHHLDMHGIFIAKGPAFKSGYQTGTLWNVDVYPLLCKIFNITPNNLIDGDINRIGFILR